MKTNFSTICIFLLTLLTLTSVFTKKNKCDITNPVYASIIAEDVASLTSNIVYSERPFITLSDDSIFYFDTVKPNTCYFKLVSNLNYNVPRLNLYSYYSDFENYKKSFETDSSVSPQISEKSADGFIISLRGTKNPVDVYNDLQMFFYTIPDYFYDSVTHIEDYIIKLNI